ncbi:uncharacterized protein [Amphiura filiformis]|uniref:uncharacterized protein n=1 Tax=Amphiura filiformis TaxID=82378 RepID=UPI003B2242AB
MTNAQSLGNKTDEIDLLLRQEKVEIGVKQARLSKQVTDHTTDGYVKLCLWNARSIRNKTTMFTEYVLEHDVDCFCVVETWLNQVDPVCIRELTLPGYSFLSTPRGASTYGGGIGALFRSEMNFQKFDMGIRKFRTFEHTCFTDPKKEVFYIVIYRPYPSSVNKLKTSEFLDDFDNFIEFVNTMSSKIVLVGDFNIHVNEPFKSDVSHFLTTIDNAGFHQHVVGPTHINGNTIDFVISRLDEDLVMNCAVDLRLSDHNVISFSVQQHKPKPKKIMVASRRLNQVLDKHAPVKNTTRSRPSNPWYNEEIHQSRRFRRKLERKWRKSRLESDRQQYITQRTVTNEMIEMSKLNFYRNELENADNKTVFKKVNGLLNRDTKVLPAHESAQELANDFASFFNNKVTTIYQDLGKDQPDLDRYDPLPERPVCVSFSEFDLLGEEDVPGDVLKALNKASTKSCLLDPVPTWFLKQNIHVFVPVITRIINESLHTGVFPDNLKHSIVTPIIKKPSLNSNDLSNFRPVSNIQFLSKLIEKQAVKSLNDHMERNNLGEKLQSAYKKAHSTETALMRVKNDIMKCISNYKSVFLVLLDLSSAFDTVNHNMLINRLQSEIEIQDDVQLYTSFDPKDPVSIAAALDNLSRCIDALKAWMRMNMLKLNDSKTEFFVTTTPHLKRSMIPVALRVGDKSICPSGSVRAIREVEERPQIIWLLLATPTLT